MKLRFAKYEGIGNDFILLEGAAPTAKQVIALCDRHRGVGADGVLVTGLRDGLPFMDVINADGSRPEMCGNGLRCVALHMSRTGAVSGESFSVQTAAGPHLCDVLGDGDVRVHMAVPSLDPASVPVRATEPVIDAPFRIAGRTVAVTAVSMGNPHAVTFDAVGDDRLQIGPALATDPRFPAGANAGFATMVTSGIELSVWERGVGWTRACGTAACAAAVAAVATGRVAAGRAIEVRLPGGTLGVMVQGPGERVIMTGPARHVFDGQVELSSP